MAPEIEVTPQQLSFGEVPVGAMKRLRLRATNTGNGDLTISALSTEPPFFATQVDGVVRPGESVDIPIAYAPGEDGAHTGELTVMSDAREAPMVTVALAGSGRAGSVVVRPAVIDFSQTKLGTVRQETVSIFNLGDLAVSGRIVSEGFARPEHYTLDGAAEFGMPVQWDAANRATLFYELVYRPLAIGADDGTIFVETCGDECGFEIAVLATAGEPAFRMTPSSIDFGETGVGVRASQVVTIENISGAPSAVTSVALEGPAELTAVPNTALPVTLPAGGAAQVEVSFRPTSIDEVTGTLVARFDHAELKEASVPIRGTGEGPLFVVSPPAVHFGVQRNPATYTGALLLTNEGSGVVLITSVSVRGDPEFGPATLAGFPARLGRGESVVVNPTFSPTAIGAYAGEVVIELTETEPRTATVPLTGGMADRLCDLAISPGRVQFGLVVAGATAQTSVTLENRGTDPCVLLSGTFAAPVDPTITLLSGAFPRTLAPGQSGSLAFAFTPTGDGESKATYTITTNDPVFPEHRLQLVGHAGNRGDCFEVDPLLLHFGSVLTGQQRSLSTHVSNISNRTCNVIQAQLAAGSDPGFTVITAGVGPIAAGRNRSVSVRFAAGTASVARGRLLIDTDDPAAPQFPVELAATTLAPQICVTPRAIDFGPAMARTVGQVEISGCGTDPVTVRAFDWKSRDSEISLDNPPSLPLILAPGDVQTIDVVYMPQDNLQDSAVLTVRSDDIAEPLIDVRLTGGENIVPTSSGRFLYHWQISGANGSINRINLQGPPQQTQFWGPGNGRGCSGCHTISPDGRYLAVVEAPAFEVTIIETATQQVVAQRRGMRAFYTSWNPNSSTTPPYQFAYSDGQDIHLASAVDGYIGPLLGASDPMIAETMPSWGPNGQIAFVRASPTAVVGISVLGTSEIVLIDEAGGTATTLSGADLPGTNYYPAFSPSGDWIAFNYSTAGRGTFAAPDARLRMVRADNSGIAVMLANANGTAGASSYPTWSVDGRYLSFSSDRPGGLGGWDLYLSEIDPITGADAPATNLGAANSTTFDHAAWWSP